MAYGLYQVNVVQPDQPIAIVNGAEVSTRTFRGRVRFAQYNLIQQYEGIERLLEVVGEDPQARSTYQVQLDNVLQQLRSRLFIGSSILELLVQEALIEQEAKRRGISVSQAEIDTWMEEFFGFFGEPTPAPQPTADQTPSPSATPYTRQVYERTLEAYLTNIGRFGVDEEAVRSEAEARLYRERLSAAFEAEVARNEDQVWARHILVDEEAGALDLLEALETGAEWEALAAESSLDTVNKDIGGDLGWFPRGRTVQSFEEAAFAAEISEIVGPVQTDRGWHLIEVLGHELRPLEPRDFQIAVSAFFDDWLSQAGGSATVEVKDYWIDRIPSPRLP